MPDNRIYYAIGDVHGEAERLARMHAAILGRHAARAEGRGGVIVHLGDYIDRGPDSRGVIETIMALQSAPPADFEVLALRGNHEQMMLDALADPESLTFLNWMSNGGRSALASYVRGRDLVPEAAWEEYVDPAHSDWLARLATLHRVPERGLVFVHAGIDPRSFPQCEDKIRIWTRSPRFFRDEAWPERPELEGVLVVHGHTPSEGFQPYVSARRINIDTGAVFGGPLTCAVLAPEAVPEFIEIDPA